MNCHLMYSKTSLLIMKIKSKWAALICFRSVEKLAFLFFFTLIIGFKCFLYFLQEKQQKWAAEAAHSEGTVNKE